MDRQHSQHTACIVLSYDRDHARSDGLAASASVNTQQMLRDDGRNVCAKVEWVARLPLAARDLRRGRSRWREGGTGESANCGGEPD